MDQNKGLTWRKSSRSGANNDNCIEVAEIPAGGRAVRDSKNATGPILSFTVVQWSAFIHGVKTGRLG
jgi:hypothetical protein